MLPPQHTGPPKFSALHRPRLLLGARTPPRDWAGKPQGSTAKGADFGDRARRNRTCHKKGWVLHALSPPSAPSSPPCLPPSWRGRNFPSTHLSPRGGGAADCPRRRHCRRRSPRPAPAGAAPSTASPAASSPPEPPPSCRRRRRRRCLPPAPASPAGVRRCPRVASL